MNFLKSKTLWASLFVAVLPYSDTISGIASGVSPLAGILIGTAFAILRIYTNKPLSEK